MSTKKIKPVDTCPFGHVVAPVQVDDGRLETHITYNHKDLASLLENLSWRYCNPFRSTKRQSDISELSRNIKARKKIAWTYMVANNTQSINAIYSIGAYLIGRALEWVATRIYRAIAKWWHKKQHPPAAWSPSMGKPQPRGRTRWSSPASTVR